MKKVKKRKQYIKRIKKIRKKENIERTTNFSEKVLAEKAYEALKDSNHNKSLPILPLPPKARNEAHFMNEMRQKYIVPLILNNHYSKPKLRTNLIKYASNFGWVNLIGLVSDLKPGKHPKILIDKISAEIPDDISGGNSIIPIDSHLWLMLDNCKGVNLLKNKQPKIKECILGVGDYLGFSAHIVPYQKNNNSLQMGIDYYFIREWGQMCFNSTFYRSKDDAAKVQLINNYNHYNDWIIKMFDLPNISNKLIYTEFILAAYFNYDTSTFEFQKVTKPSNYLPYFKRMENN